MPLLNALIPAISKHSGIILQKALNFTTTREALCWALRHFLKPRKQTSAVTGQKKYGVSPCRALSKFTPWRVMVRSCRVTTFFTLPRMAGNGLPAGRNSRICGCWKMANGKWPGYSAMTISPQNNLYLKQRTLQVFFIFA